MWQRNLLGLLPTSIVCRLLLQHAEHDFGQLGFRFSRRIQNFLNVHWLQRFGKAQISDDLKAKHAQSAVNGDDHFWDCGHADNVGANRPQESIFGARFQIRAHYRSIDSPVR